MTDKFTQLPGEWALRQRGAGESKREHHGRFDAYQSRPVKQSDGKRLRAHDVDKNPDHHALTYARISVHIFRLNDQTSLSAAR